jgi:hypothetical protein
MRICAISWRFALRTHPATRRTTRRCCVCGGCMSERVLPQRVGSLGVLASGCEEARPCARRRSVRQAERDVIVVVRSGRGGDLQAARLVVARGAHRSAQFPTRRRGPFATVDEELSAWEALRAMRCN